MKYVLVGTDGSDGAGRAVDYAAHWAKESGARLLVVNVIGGSLPDKTFSRLTHAEQTWLKELHTSLSAETLEKAREQARRIGVNEIELESCTGDAAQAIIDIAQKKGVETIVVGKRGAGRIVGLLVGSVSQKIVSLAHRPVIVVP